METYRVQQFDPARFQPADVDDGVHVVFKETRYDPARQIAMTRVVVVEDDLTQHFWIEVVREGESNGAFAPRLAAALCRRSACNARWTPCARRARANAYAQSSVRMRGARDIYLRASSGVMLGFLCDSPNSLQASCRRRRCCAPARGTPRAPCQAR
jgi:hypothetical protein